jgi:hypothetical protein
VTTQDPKFEQGLQTIQTTFEAEFSRRGIHIGSISHVRLDSRPHDAIFKILANGVSQEMLFTHEEITKSAQNIRASAAAKVRTLGGFFASIDDTQ